MSCNASPRAFPSRSPRPPPRAPPPPPRGGFPPPPGGAAAGAEPARAAGARFDEARGILARVGQRERKPAVLIMEAYWRTYRALMARGFVPPRRPVALARWEKAWLVFRRGVV